MKGLVVAPRPKGARATGGTRWRLGIALSGQRWEGRPRRRPEVRGLGPAAAAEINVGSWTGRGGDRGWECVAGQTLGFPVSEL